MRHAVRAHARLLAATVVTLAAAVNANAGPTNSAHRFERIGMQADAIAAVLPFPGAGRSLVLQRDGEMRLTTGDGLVNELIGTLPVSQTCPEEGALGATWHPTYANALYVTYVQASPRRFAVARVDFTGRVPSAPQVVVALNIPASACTNFGGGIAVGADGKLYVGMGDLGNPAGASQISTLAGKILRLNDTPPALPADNPIPGSPVYAQGVRNPIRLAADPAPTSNAIYFLDPGAGSNDELNMTGPDPLYRGVNYGWPTGAGPLLRPEFVDPVYTWSTAIQPTGLTVYRADNLGRDLAGDVIVAGATGTIRVVDGRGVHSTLYDAGAGEPGDFADLTVRPDGYVYVLQRSGQAWRLRSDAALVQEPSDDESIVPLLVKKTTAGAIEVMVERETAVEQYGLYVGDVNALAASGYTHPATTTDVFAVDGNRGSAWTTLTPGTTGSAVYFLASALNQRSETALGTDSEGVVRPGGNQTFGCPCDVAASAGREVGDCEQPFTLANGVIGENGAGGYNYTGPHTFLEDWDCKVILLDMSMEWCGPCRAMAEEAEALYQEFINEDFMLIHIVPEDFAGAPAGMSAAERWTRDFGLTFPVFPDNNYLVWSLYDNSGAIPQTMLFSRNGEIVEHWTGFLDLATLRNAIQTELNR